jgi:hypothetical protein
MRGFYSSFDGFLAHAEIALFIADNLSVYVCRRHQFIQQVKEGWMISASKTALFGSARAMTTCGNL